MSHVRLPFPLSVLSLFVTLHLPKQRLERLGPVASRVGVEYPGIKKCVTALGPEPSHPDVCSGIRVSVGGWVPEGFSCQRLQLRLDLDVVVYFLHA